MRDKKVRIDFDKQLGVSLSSEVVPSHISEVRMC